MLTFKNAGPIEFPGTKKNTGNKVDEQKYFEAIAKWEPNIDRAEELKKLKKQLKEKFEQRKNEM